MDVEKEKIIQNINRLLPKANAKQLLLFYQIAYEIVKKA